MRPSVARPPAPPKKTTPGVTWMSRLVWLAATCVAGMSIITPAVDRAAGIAAMRSLAIVTCRLTLCVSTTGVSPVTMMVSCTVPTVMSALIDAVKVPANSIPSRLTVLKPVRPKVTV